MGVDLRAIFIHHFDESNILNAPDLLNADQPLAVAIKDYLPLSPEADINPFHWHGYSSNETDSHPLVKNIWDNERIKGFNDEGISVDSSSNWDGGIYFARRLCMICDPLRWHYFVEDASWQKRTRNVYAAVAKVCGASKVLYVPDSGFHTSGLLNSYAEDMPFIQIAKRAMREFGPPRAFLTQGVTQSRSNFKFYDTYFVDDCTIWKDEKQTGEPMCSP